MLLQLHTVRSLPVHVCDPSAMVLVPSRESREEERHKAVVVVFGSNWRCQLLVTESPTTNQVVLTAV